MGWDNAKARRAIEESSLEEAAVTRMDNDTAATEKRKGVINHWKSHHEGGEEERVQYGFVHIHDT
jgi:hypothetical protein